MLSRPASIAGIVPALVTALMFSACAGQRPVEEAPGQAGARAAHRPAPAQLTRTLGEQAAVVAVRQVGVPYRYGGSGRGGFDCSGLVYYAYAQAGKQVPRTTASLWKAMRPVGERDLQVGDVLFFNIAGKMSHVGLYIGQRRFVHAPSSGREVTIAELDAEFYRRAFLRGGRPR